MPQQQQQPPQQMLQPQQQQHLLDESSTVNDYCMHGTVSDVDADTGADLF